MTHTFKLARRTARLRAGALALLVTIAGACDGTDRLAPATEAPIAGTDAEPTTSDSLSNDSTASGLSLYTSSTAPGVPFGDFHLPTSLFSSSTYSGSLQALWPSGVYSVLNNAKSNGERVVISLAGNRKYYINSDGTFNLSKWKSRIYAYRSYNFGTYLTSGTVLGHYLVDEPYCTGCWGGRAIPTSTLEEMARYSKSLWPKMPTTVRVAASRMPLQAYRYLDFAWAQWEGPLHGTSFKRTPEQFRDNETSAARARGLGVMFGLNYLDGGDGSSRINGTYAKDPNLYDNIRCTSRGCYRYQMSASEVKRVGAVLAGASYGCGVVSWKYNSTFLSRSGMRDAMNYVSGVARNRSRSSCVR